MIEDVQFQSLINSDDESDVGIMAEIFRVSNLIHLKILTRMVVREWAWFYLHTMLMYISWIITTASIGWDNISKIIDFHSQISNVQW